jgi:cation/acetate symporter
MVYATSSIAVLIFIGFVLSVLGLSFYFANKSQSAEGYFAAGGTIHWAVNGIAFAGDYLSAASFLGICGMIAAAGYDGFLYSIGYLAGWIVALFIIAEPMKRLGKYTFSDALDSKFNSRRIRLMAAISTIVVSMFYLIPQMVGAGVLVTPLLGLSHSVGVILVGAIVITIVATAGMTSTTYVQFLKGTLLIIFSLILVGLVLARGISINPDQGGRKAYHDFKNIIASVENNNINLDDTSYRAVENWQTSVYYRNGFVELKDADNTSSFWKFRKLKNGNLYLTETQYVMSLPSGKKLYNGAPKEAGKFHPVGHIVEINDNGKKIEKTGPLGPFSFISKLKNSTIVLWGKTIIKDNGKKVTIYYQKPIAGKRVLRPGLKFKVENATTTQKLNFVSLMLALFFGTAALPHILIRYYTVREPKCARKSTIVAIAAIGLFYILTMYMGLGAMVNGVLNLTDTNMAGPLLALSFGVVLFAIISAIAFATVLGTVSGLIVAATGAVAHDFFDIFLRLDLKDETKVKIGKITAVVVGIIAIYLGIIFKGMNVSFLVGWAFAVAASANLPSMIMVLFWKKTTKSGVGASIFVGMVSAVGLILLSPDMFVRYGKLASEAPLTLNNPGIISIPLSFLTLVVVSLLTQSSLKQKAKA